MAGWGMNIVELGGMASLIVCFKASYVVKKAPEDGIVKRMIDPTPW